MSADGTFGVEPGETYRFDATITKRTATLTVKRSRNPLRSQRWYWTLTAANGRKIATSGEGYANQTECMAMAYSVCSGKYRAYERVVVS